MIEIPHDWFDYTNFTIGVSGLLLTLWAIREATRAKNAAEQARQAVYRRNANDDVGRLLQLASGLVAALQSKQFDLALYRARDFILECPKVREHHRSRLGRDGAGLDNAFNLVHEILRRLSDGRNSSDLIAAGERVVENVGTLLGVLSRTMEEEGQ